MKLHLAAACLAATVSFAGAAMAEGSITATLENPIASRTKLIAAGAVWVCEKSACIAGRTPDGTLDASSCQQLARQVGRISAYQGERKALEAAALQRCNVGARAAKPAAAHS